MSLVDQEQLRRFERDRLAGTTYGDDDAYAPPGQQANSDRMVGNGPYLEATIAPSAANATVSSTNAAAPIGNKMPGNTVVPARHDIAGGQPANTPAPAAKSTNAASRAAATPGTPATPVTSAAPAGATNAPGATTPEEAAVLNALRSSTKRFDPTWLVEAQKKLNVTNASGAFNTETLRALRAHQKNPTLDAAAILAGDAFLKGIWGTGTPFIETREGFASQKRGKGDSAADRAAKAVGYANYIAYKEDFTNIVFLGKTLKGRGHKFLAERLAVAETYLINRMKALGHTINTPKDVWPHIEWNGEGNASYATDDDTTFSHQHTMGLAIDIDKEQNPWIFAVTINDDTKDNKWWANTYWPKVFEVATKMYPDHGGGEMSTPNLMKWSEELSTEELWAKVSGTSKAFVELMELAKGKNDKLILEKLTAAGYEEADAKVIRDKTVKPLPGYWVDRFGRTKATKSFTNQGKELVIALRDVAGLSWGGSEMHSTENGDFMHWDCRQTTFGNSVYLKSDQRPAPK